MHIRTVIGVFAMGLPALVLPEFSCDDVQLQQEITLLSAQINVASYRLLKLIAELDNRVAWRCGGTVRSCAHWLAAQKAQLQAAANEISRRHQSADNNELVPGIVNITEEKNARPGCASFNAPTKEGDGGRPVSSRR